MKQRFITINNLVKALIVAGFITTASVPALANKDRKAINPAPAIASSVQYIGSEKSGDLFSVKLNSEAPLKFTVIIRDGFGDMVYRKNFEANSFSKVFKLVNETGADLADLNFVIRVENGKEYRFTVNRSSNLVNEVTISKL